MISLAPANASARWGAETATVDRRLRQGHRPDSVLGRRRAQAVALDRPADDLPDLVLSHLNVGLVFELGDLSCHAGEGDDGPGAADLEPARAADPGPAADRLTRT